MSPGNATAAVELRGVTKSFGAHAVVRDVSLAIPRGEFFSLLGPSGCGKTTTLRIIAGFETPSAGAVLLDGTDITDRQPHERHIGMVFQNYALFPHLSVFENVAFPLRLRHLPAAEIGERVGTALDMVRLPGLADRRPDQLSGGQQQRVALARALVFRPAVVLLDEPLGALDLKLRKAMQLELKTLQREVGLTFVYVTHDQEEALTMSDRIALMDSGRVLQVADPRTLYERPESRFVADFIGVSNFLPATVREIAGGRALLQVAGCGTVAALSDGRLRPDLAVTVALRPERLRLSRRDVPAGENENALDGTIRDVVFTGSDTQYYVGLGAGPVVAVRVPNDQPPEHRAEAGTGDQIRVCWDIASTAVLTA